MIALLPRTHRYVLGFMVNSVKTIDCDHQRSGLPLWQVLVCAQKDVMQRGGKRCYNYCTTMGLWPAEAIRPQRRLTKLISVGFSTGLLALVPHCVVLCFLWYPVKLVRANNTTITSTDCRLMLMLVMIIMIPLTINLTLAELCHVSWGM